MFGEWERKRTTTEPMHVLPPGVADHGVALGFTLGGFEAGARDEDVGCVGAAWMFAKRGRSVSS